MNVAVDVDHQRRGLASALLAELYARVDDERRALHARGAPLQRRRDPPLRARGLPRGGHAPPLLPGQRRGRARDVAHAGDARRARSATCPIRDRYERSSRWRRAATTPAPPSSTRDGRMRANVISSQEVHDALRRRRAGDRLAPPPRAGQRWSSTQALERGRRDARRRRARRRDAGPGARRRAARRPLDGEGAGGRARAAVRGRRPSAGARRGELPAGGRRTAIGRRSSRRSSA